MNQSTLTLTCTRLWRLTPHPDPHRRATTPYTFEGPDGTVSLPDLFEGRPQLVMPGISVFLRVEDQVFHTYSTFGRGIEEFHNGYQYLDLTALGRQEEWEEPRGRAAPLGLQVGGPAMRLPDEYDDT